MNILPLSEEWGPPELLIRGKELKILKKSLDSPFLRHYWIHGKNGTGKTVTTKYNYMPYSQLKGCKVFYHSMERGGTGNNLESWTRGFMPRKTRDMDEVISYIHNENPGGCKLVFIFDDLQNLINMKRDFSPVLLKIFNRAGDYREKEGYRYPFQVILVSQIPFTKRERYMKNDILDRYQFGGLCFGRYDRRELEKILIQRIKYIYGNVTQGKRQVCRQLASIVEDRMESNLRTAMTILKKTILDNDGRFTQKNLMDTINHEETLYWKDSLLKEFTPHRALILYIIAGLTANHPWFCGTPGKEDMAKHRDGIADRSDFIDKEDLPVAFDDLEKSYYDNCQKFNIPSHTRVMVYKDVEILNQSGVIEKFLLSKKNELNYKKKTQSFVRLGVDRETILRVGEQIDWIDLLNGSRP